MTDLPLAARIQLGHAVLQSLADQAGIDLLHIKGYAVDPGLYRPGRTSTDVDVWVRPSQAADLLTVLESHGWDPRTSFASGSIFEHAATLFHEHWGWVDVHRLIPGIGVDPEAAFERFWADRKTAEIAGFPCSVPTAGHQAWLVVIHEARAPGLHLDTEHLRGVLGSAGFEELNELAHEMGAAAAWGAALGCTDGSSDPLWAAVRDGATGVRLLRARLRAEATLRGRLRLLVSAAVPNRDHLRMKLRREPTAADCARDLLRRMKGVFA